MIFFIYISTTQRVDYLVRSPEYFGTYHLHLGLDYRFRNTSKFNHFAGLAYNWSYSSLYRLITWYGWDNPPPINQPLLADSYTRETIELRYRNQWKILSSLSIGSQWSTEFLFRRKAHEFGSDHYLMQRLDPQLFSFSWSMGINYQFPVFTIGLNYRFLYHQKFDYPIISELVNTRAGRKGPWDTQWGDWYNPVHLSLELVVPFTKQ